MNTKERTPVPVLGDGWFLLTAEDGEFREGDKISSDANGRHWVPKSWPTCIQIADWLRHDSTCLAARYFGPTKEPEPAVKPIDWTKPVRTKGTKKPVRVVCTDGPGDYPVVGFVGDSTNPDQWTLDGKWIDDDVDEDDLENAPQRIQREYWVNVYDGVETLLWYDTKKEADENGGQRFACVKITIDCEEGEGL